jgi:hypothetical protein
MYSVVIQSQNSPKWPDIPMIQCIQYTLILEEPEHLVDDGIWLFQILADQLILPIICNVTRV